MSKIPTNMIPPIFVLNFQQYQILNYVKYELRQPLSCNENNIDSLRLIVHLSQIKMSDEM